MYIHMGKVGIIEYVCLYNNKYVGTQAAPIPSSHYIHFIMCPQLGRYHTFVQRQRLAKKKYDGKPRPAVALCMYVQYIRTSTCIICNWYFSESGSVCYDMICSPNRQIRTKGSPKISGILLCAQDLIEDVVLNYLAED